MLQEFVDRFPVEAWRELPVESYALGQQAEGGTVCWWMESRRVAVVGPPPRSGRCQEPRRYRPLRRGRRFVLARTPRDARAVRLVRAVVPGGSARGSSPGAGDRSASPPRFAGAARHRAGVGVSTTCAARSRPATPGAACERAVASSSRRSMRSSPSSTFRRGAPRPSRARDRSVPRTSAAIREEIVNGVVHRDWASAAPTVVEHVGRTLVVSSLANASGRITARQTTMSATSSSAS